MKWQVSMTRKFHNSILQTRGRDYTQRQPHDSKNTIEAKQPAPYSSAIGLQNEIEGTIRTKTQNKYTDKLTTTKNHHHRTDSS